MNYVCITRALREVWVLFGLTNTYTAPDFHVPFSPFAYMGKP